MKRLILLFIASTFCFSCKKDFHPRNFDSISIEEFKMDSTSIRTIHVISADEIYFAGSKGDIGHSVDGGKSWTKKYIKHNDSITPHFRSMASNGTNLFALAITSPALLYKITKNDTTLVYTEKHEKAFYDSMKFFDANNGIAMGDPTYNCLSIILTSDGGNSWHKIPCDKLPLTADGEAAFAASNTNIKILGNTVWIVTGGKKARVFKSIDMGQTWNVYNTPIVQGLSTQGIYSVDFFDENNGIIIGGDYSKSDLNTSNKAITIDGGKIWTLVADNQNPNYKSCVQYVPNTNGKEVFAVGKTGVSFSNDGGITWKDVSKDSYYTIQFVDKNTAWLSGHEKIGKLVLKPTN